MQSVRARTQKWSCAEGVALATSQRIRCQRIAGGNGPQARMRSPLQAPSLAAEFAGGAPLMAAPRREGGKFLGGRRDPLEVPGRATAKVRECSRDGRARGGGPEEQWVRAWAKGPGPPHRRPPGPCEHVPTPRGGENRGASAARLRARSCTAVVDRIHIEILSRRS